MISLSGEPLHLRPIETRHENYVRRTWLESWRDLVRGTGVPEDLFFGGARPIVDTLLEHTHVAVTERSPGTVHGWIAGTAGKLFFVYTPWELRRKGIARSMITQVCRETL